MIPELEPGLCVEVSEDGSRVLMTLDSQHATELARIIASLAVRHGPDDSWAKVAQSTADDTWLGTMLRLIACSQNLAHSNSRTHHEPPPGPDPRLVHSSGKCRPRTPSRSAGADLDQAGHRRRPLGAEG
jgi:hypothetical protein